jgi:hypothetical protein
MPSFRARGIVVTVSMSIRKNVNEAIDELNGPLLFWLNDTSH